MSVPKAQSAEDGWIAQDLGHALDVAPEQIEVHFQPIVDIKTHRTVGMEALARWRHPERGMIGPDRFIPVAEETGLIVALGRRVLHDSCRAAAAWPRHVALSVNMSPIQLQNVTIVDDIARILDKTGLPPRRLELEITESVFLDKSDENVSALHRLRDTGISIALDDFGTGYASLTYLRVFPFDKIKIDRTFVNDMPKRDDCAAIVCAVANLGRSLGMTTTAEGVETQEQVDLLRAAGVTLGQGYLFGRPAKEAKFNDARIEKRPGPVARPGVLPELSAAEIMLVRSSFARLVPQQIAVAGLFYDRLFEIAPELRTLFPRDLTLQKEKLMDMLAAGIGKLNDLQSLTVVLKGLGARHADYGATSAHYDHVAEALIGTLDRGLGAAFTPDVRSAWIKVYGLLSSTMQSGVTSRDDTAAA